MHPPKFPAGETQSSQWGVSENDVGKTAVSNARLQNIQINCFSMSPGNSGCSVPAEISRE